MKTSQQRWKIAFFMRCLVGGGSERVVVNLANHLSSIGHQVKVVLANHGGAFVGNLSPQVPCVDLKCKRLWRALPKLTQYLRDYSPDVLISGLHYPNEIAILARYLSVSSTKIIVVEHNTLSLEARHAPQFRAKLTPITARLLYPFADRIVAVSNGVADDLAKTAKLNRDQITTIYNPIITTAFNPEYVTVAEHHWLKEDGIPVIMGIGRLVAQKDFKTLLTAIQVVNQKRSVRLLILGKGKQKGSLQQYIEKHGLEETIQLVGFSHEPLRYLKGASAFVLSSRWEGFGNVVVEAMAMKVSVIATDCPHGPREILKNGEFGHLVPVGNPEAIAEAILKVLGGDRRLPPREWRSQFTCENAAASYLSLL